MWLLGVVLITLVIGSYGAEGDGDDKCKGRETKESSTEERLLEDIMCGYTDEMRPVKNHTHAVDVVVRLSLKYLTFDDQEETLTVHSWVGLRWVDEYLTWEPSNYASIKEIQIESHRLWQPQLALYNADANSYTSVNFYSPCVVNNTGGIICVPHVAHTAICTTKLRNWPFDTQNCTLRFGSWMHTGEQVNFMFSGFSPVSTNDFSPGPGWKLLDVTSDRHPGNYKCCPNDTYPSLRYHFVLQRIAAGHAAIIVVPSFVVVVLTLTSLLLDVKDNTRLSLLCFSLFGHFMFLTSIGYVLPKHGSDTPIILLFLRDSMIINLLGIILTLIFSSLRTRVEPPYIWITQVNGVFSGAAKFAIFTEFEPGLLSDKEEDLAGSSAAESRVAASRDWTTFCNICNCLSFIILLVVYAILLFKYLPRN